MNRMQLPNLEVLGIAFVATLVACTSAVDLDREREALMDADRAFAEATAARGADGWASVWASDGMQFSDGREPTRGPAAIRELMAPVFADSGSYIKWEPIFADVGSGGDLGYTHGTSEGRIITEAGDTVAFQGRYVTIWKKNADGVWRAVVDIGVDR